MRWKVVAAIVAVIMAGTLAAVLVPKWWQARVEAEKNTAAGTSGAVSYYPSVAFMADRITCRSTLHDVPLTPGIRSAGTCTLPSRQTGSGTTATRSPGLVRIDMRVGDTTADAATWLSAAHQDLSDGAGAVGGNWAIKISGTHDRAVINRILAALP